MIFIVQILLIISGVFAQSYQTKKTELSDFKGSYTFIDAYVHKQEYKYLSNNYLGVGYSYLEYPIAKLWRFDLYFDQSNQLSGSSITMNQSIPLSNIRLISDTLKFDISIPGRYSRSCKMFQDKSGKKWMSVASGLNKVEFRTLKVSIDSTLVMTSNGHSFMRETQLNIDSINANLVDRKISEIEGLLLKAKNPNEQSRLREAISILKSKL